MPSITTNNKSLFYTLTPQTANLDNPSTTLLIHGLGSSSCFYHTIIPQISTVSTCIALDTPGSGLSTLDPNSKQSVQSIVSDIIALLDALSTSVDSAKVWVVGHSMGGMIACELAAKHPDRVAGLLLLGPISPSPQLTSVFTTRIENVQLNGLESLADSIPTAATGSFSTPTQRAFIRALILGTSTAGYISLCEVIASATKPEYAAIYVPIMILAGGEDKTAPLEGCRGIFDGVGTGDEWKGIEVLEGVGHWHAVEAPERVAQEFLEFFGEMERSG